MLINLDLSRQNRLRWHESGSRLLCSILYLDHRFTTHRSWHGKLPINTSNHLTHLQTFTIGRGNDLVCAAIDLVTPLIVNQDLDALTANWGRTWRYLTSDSQLRWVGPEKGVIHLALGAVVNALWDLWAKTLNKPVWQVIAEMTPDEIVRCIDFRYITDALTPEEATEILQQAQLGKAERVEEALQNRAVPAYTTSAGWLGYSEEKMTRLLQQSVDEGYRHFKLKVGRDLEEDRKRLTIARNVLGFDNGHTLMIDANQVCCVEYGGKGVFLGSGGNPRRTFMLTMLGLVGARGNTVS